MNNELQEKVEEALRNSTDEGDALTFQQLLRAVAEPGECLNCLESPVRRALVKLIDAGRVVLALNG